MLRFLQVEVSNVIVIIMKRPVIIILMRITGSEKGDEYHPVKTGIWSYRMYLIRND